MHAVAITGPDADDLAEQLAERLPGRVAIVRNADADGGVARERSRPAETTYTLSADGWSARGPARSLRDVLDDLAPDHDHALAVGFAGARLPTLVAGDAAAADDDGGGDVLATVPDPADADLEDLSDAVTGTEPYETLGSLVSEVKRSPRADRAGAIATFTGRVRARDSDDDARTEYLEFEKYEGVAEQRMVAISRELEEREGVLEVRMHHRTGVVPDGEDIVFVVVLAGHRREAFRTVEDGIDRLKDEVPLFKKEVTVEDEFWVHERD